MTRDFDEDTGASAPKRTPNASTPTDRPSGDRNSVDPLSRKGANKGKTPAERMVDLERQAEGASPDRPAGPRP
jgi:hypothetical protein